MAKPKAKPDEREDEDEVLVEGEDEKESGAAKKEAAPPADGGELVEVPPEVDPKTGKPVEQEDRGLSVEAGAETIEQRRERRRAEKKDRMARQRRAREERDRELAELRLRNRSLEDRLGGIDQRLTAQDVANIDARIEALRARAEEIKSLYAQAIKAQDGEAAAQAMELRDEAVFELRALQGYKAGLARGGPAKQAAAAPAGPSPAVARRIATFKERHPWYDTKGGDEDSALVIALDNQVARDGFKEDTDEYWEELERRIAARGLGPDDEDEKEEGARPNGKGHRPAPKERGPQLGGGRTPAGPATFFVSKERKDAMIAAGYWDDPAKRASMIRRYRAEDAARAAERQGG